MVEQKKCRACQQVKPLAEFSLRNQGKVGARCKACSAKAQREWYSENKDEIKIERSIAYLTDALNKLRRKAKDQGLEIKVQFTDQFIITAEPL